MAPTFSHGMQLGTAAPAFSLPGVDGRTYSLESFKDSPVLVVIFTCNHCPYAMAYEERLVALQRDYGPRGVQVVGINPNDDTTHPEDSFDAMVVRARERGFKFPYLRDASQSVARAYEAMCTPDVFVFDAARRLVYAGRIDDSWQEPANATRHELRLALDATLAGRAVDFKVTPAMGCSIKWKQQ